jgi:hypothetical protein
MTGGRNNNRGAAFMPRPVLLGIDGNLFSVNIHVANSYHFFESEHH